LSKNNWPEIIFRLAYAILLFLAGGLMAMAGKEPFPYIRDSMVKTKLVFDEYFNSHPFILYNKQYNKEGVTNYNKNLALNGWTIIQGTVSDTPEIKIIDMEGKELHKWTIDYFKYWKDDKHLKDYQSPKSIFNTHSMGLHLYKDGSILVNISYKGLIKLDYCSNLIWKINKPTHHSITVDGDSIWVPSGRPVEDTPDQFFINIEYKKQLKSKEIDNQKFSSSLYDNTTLQISSDGKIISEFSIIESLYDSNLEFPLYIGHLLHSHDPIHINDIEIVTKELSKKIKNVNPGDLLVSVRNMSMLIILDRVNGKMKWYHIGPWVLQHDPDITREGNITVFNNSRKGSYINRPKGSSIIDFNPKDNSHFVKFPKNNRTTFYTKWMGSHQLLPNNNILISESYRGRVLEVTPSGELAWEYISNYNDRYASLISYSERIDTGYIDINRQCKNNKSK
jgi:hypothetical protein